MTNVPDQTADAPPASDDSILPFHLARADIRGRVARLDGALETILRQHDYPPSVAALVAEAALLTALIGQTLKLRWRLSIQVRGDGPIRLIATDYFAPEAEGEPARIRAYAGYDREAPPPSAADPFTLLGKGVFGLMIDQGRDMAPYQGVTPLAGSSLADCAETYFAQSEQIATRFAVTAAEASAPGGPSVWRAGGVMVQHLPAAGEHVRTPDAPSGPDGLMTSEDIAAMGDGEDNWRRATMLLETVEAHELLGPHVSAERLLVRLFHEEAPVVYPAQTIAFGCTCSAERVEAAMAQYSAKDIGHMTDEDGKLTADCQFCGAHYEFDPKTLGFEAER
jgi:molecular chaperone Hsp33